MSMLFMLNDSWLYDRVFCRFIKKMILQLKLSQLAKRFIQETCWVCDKIHILKNMLARSGSNERKNLFLKLIGN